MAKRVVFTAPNQVALEDYEVRVDDVAEDEVLVRTAYSLISPGTELACLAGTEDWAPLPFVPGYASCGQVVAAGSAVAPDVGDQVLIYGKHAAYARANRLIIPLPDDVDLRHASFARMAAVSMTAVRVGQPELGDWAAVTGLGLVGNLCAQLLTLAGCEVIGIDIEPARLELARQCGIRHVVNSRETDIVEAVRDLTCGQKCDLVVDATGISAVAVQNADLAAKQGTVVLLGSPRADYQADMTPFLRKIHLWGAGCVTYKGAHEWRFPPSRDRQGFCKHSIQRNIEIILRMMGDGRLVIDPLLTHVLSPERCSEAYAGLRGRRDEYVGVVFDWSRL